MGSNGTMQDIIEKKRLAILQILYREKRALGSRFITDELLAKGVDISERTVRFHLAATDKEGLTEYIGKQGRRITEAGIAELSRARIFEKVGFLAEKIDEMTYNMNFDLEKKEGTVVVNVSFLKIEDLLYSCNLMKRVYDAGYAMGKLIGFFPPGEILGELRVPEGKVGVGTVCSVTLNGVLLSHGVPVTSLFGGLLEIRERKPIRFVEIIRYDGTTIDPLEIFIKSKMTDYLGATSTGNGQIGASFREVPAVSRNQVLDLAERLDSIGLGAFMQIGWPGQSLLEVPINQGRVGAIIIGGLNPIAILEEDGVEVWSKALCSHMEYKRLFPYTEMKERAEVLLKKL